MIHRSRTSGFTLIELLVCIAIMALLVGILLPVLSRAREAGRRAVCGSHTRQIAMIWLTYATDNGGEFPYRDANGPFYMSRGGTGFDTRPLVASYTQSLDVFYCPSTNAGPDTPSRWNVMTGGGNTLIDYAIMARWYRRTSGANTANLVQFTGPRARFITNVDDASGDLVMLSDQMWNSNSLPFPTWFNHMLSEGVGEGWEGGNVTRYDGSTVWQYPEAMQLQASQGVTFVFF